MALASLMEYLDARNVAYIVISHSPAYTAQVVAGLAHISGKELAKTVIVKLDGKLAMAVLPAKFHVDLELLRKMGSKIDSLSARPAQCRRSEICTESLSLPMTAWRRTRRLRSMQGLTEN